MSDVEEKDVVIGMSINQYAHVQGMLGGFATLLKQTAANKKNITPESKAEVAKVIGLIDETKASLHQCMIEAVATAAKEARETEDSTADGLVEDALGWFGAIYGEAGSFEDPLQEPTAAEIDQWVESWSGRASSYLAGEAN